MIEIALLIVVQMSRKLSFLWGDPCTLQIIDSGNAAVDSGEIFNIDSDRGFSPVLCARGLCCTFL